MKSLQDNLGQLVAPFMRTHAMGQSCLILSDTIPPSVP